MLNYFKAINFWTFDFTGNPHTILRIIVFCCVFCKNKHCSLLFFLGLKRIINVVLFLSMQNNVWCKSCNTISADYFFASWSKIKYFLRLDYLKFINRLNTHTHIFSLTTQLVTKLTGLKFTHYEKIYSLLIYIRNNFV